MLPHTGQLLLPNRQSFRYIFLRTRTTVLLLLTPGRLAISPLINSSQRGGGCHVLEGRVTLR